jgi:hypothetical protein
MLRCTVSEGSVTALNAPTDVIIFEHSSKVIRSAWTKDGDIN